MYTCYTVMYKLKQLLVASVSSEEKHWETMPPDPAFLSIGKDLLYILYIHTLTPSAVIGTERNALDAAAGGGWGACPSGTWVHYMFKSVWWQRGLFSLTNSCYFMHPCTSCPAEYVVCWNMPTYTMCVSASVPVFVCCSLWCVDHWSLQTAH